MGRAFEYRRASKEKRWDKMSKVFPKLGKMITIAAKESGSDPSSNAKLRTAIINAKAENMPKDNIDKAIKRATDKDATDYQEANYEGKGPHGVLIWVECATDNPTRTVANVRTCFNKGGGQMMNSGSLEFMFSYKAVVEFEQTEDQNLEEIELELIDHGLEEMEVVEDRVYLYGEFSQFHILSKGCEDLGIEVSKASLQRIANDPIQITEAQMEEVEVLIDKLEEDDDVQNVFTNLS